MRIAVLVQHYHTPDCPTAARPWSLVRALARRHEVTLITTEAWRAQRLTRRFDWVPPGVRLVALDVPYANAMTTRERLRAFLDYAAKAAWKGATGPRPDLVYASSTPLTVGAAGAALAARWRCPWIFEVRDLWPDFPVQMGALEAAGVARPLVRRALYGLERALYRNADRVVTVSPDMARHVRRFAAPPGKVSCVPYGADFSLLDETSDRDVDAFRQALGLSAGRPVVLYAGSFGRANALPTLVEAARRLGASFEEETRSPCFVFAGDGYHRPLLERAARELSNVHLLAPQPYPRTLALFRLADVSVVSFIDRPVLRANAPSKLFDSLAAGTPVVVTQDGWTRAFVERHACGWHVPPEAPGALAACLRGVLADVERCRVAGAKAERAARRHLDRAVHMERLLSIIKRVHAGAPPAPPAEKTLLS